MVEEEKKPEETNKEEESKDEKESNGETGGGGDPPAPQDIVLKVFMHCEGCAEKVRRSLKGFPGVKEVITDRKSSIVVVKGEKADPLKVLERVQGKSRRVVELLSPILIPDALPKEEEKKPKTDQEAPQIATVVLKVHMHCEVCAQEIKKRIEKIKGVESAEADLKKWEVIVKGLIKPAKLLEYVYKRLGKHAVIVNQEVAAAAAEEVEEKKETVEDKKEPVEEEVGEKENKAEKEEENKGEGDGGSNEEAKPQEEEKKKEEEKEEEEAAVTEKTKAEEEMEIVNNEYYYFDPLRNGMEFYHAAYPPPPPYAYYYNYYQTYPPQIFSDENPNACTIM